LRKIQKLEILLGFTEFARRFKGDLTTETMSIQDMDDNMEKIEKAADFVAGLKPNKIHIVISKRPSAEKN
jgi:wyosine [tRNA(Phe)-imidazoG37] synthetase (radical SAM superfamily)